MLIVGIMCDKVQQMIQIEGILLNIVDMVGLCDMEDEVECIGIECIWVVIVCVDVVLYLLDVVDYCVNGFLFEDVVIDVCIVEYVFVGVLILCVVNKIDFFGVVVLGCVDIELFEVWFLVCDGLGVELLCVVLLEIVGWQGGGEGFYFVCECYFVVLCMVCEYLVIVVEYVDQ